MKITSFFLALNLLPFVVNSVFAQIPTHQSQCATDTNSFFPLLQGSYWIWQDTVLRKQNSIEISETVKPQDCFTKDSIISLVNNGSYCTATIKRTIHAAAVDSYSFAYQIDSCGVIWYSDSKKHKIGIATPKQNDTIFDEIGTRYIFKSKIYEVAIATSSLEKVFYRKGIGCTNRLDINKSGKNLIEYRIGNGPIIKKHWLMEAPKGK